MSEAVSKNKRNSKPRRSSSTDDNDVLQSITAKTVVLLHPQVTLTCYIPTTSVGAVIGRRGSTILQIQRHAQQIAGQGPVRVSIVGHDEEDVPYTYSELDWSSPHWTPVVIRADPCAALATAQRLLDIVGEMDEVVLDLPLARTKHASLIGKRGLVLANLSADTSVRIMVPQKQVRHDVVQLEGELHNVRKCCERVLQLCETKPPPTTLVVPVLPSQTKLRNVSRKTETTIRKKKMEDDAWQLTITGTTADQIQAAMTMLERWHEEQQAGGETTSPTSTTTNNNNAASTNNSNTTTTTGNNSSNNTPRRNPGRGRGRGRNTKGKANKGKPAANTAAESPTN